jgi:hypothetical protein
MKTRVEYKKLERDVEEVPRNLEQQSYTRARVLQDPIIEYVAYINADYAESRNDQTPKI